MDLLFHNVSPYYQGWHWQKDGFKCYAATGWTPDDVLEIAENVFEPSIKLTEEQATEFLEQHGKHVVDTMVREGRLAIEVLLPDWIEDLACGS